MRQMTKTLLLGSPETAFNKTSYAFIPVVQASLQGIIFFMNCQDQECVRATGTRAGTQGPSSLRFQGIKCNHYEEKSSTIVSNMWYLRSCNEHPKLLAYIVL